MLPKSKCHQLRVIILTPTLLLPMGFVDVIVFWGKFLSLIHRLMHTEFKFDSCAASLEKLKSPNTATNLLHKELNIIDNVPGSRGFITNCVDFSARVMVYSRHIGTGPGIEDGLGAGSIVCNTLSTGTRTLCFLLCQSHALYRLWSRPVWTVHYTENYTLHLSFNNDFYDGIWSAIWCGKVLDISGT